MRQRISGRARALVVATIVVLATAAGADAQPAPGRPAPEITAGRWINSAPLSIDGLRGRVVLIEFWTFG